ncbi:MAG TPA: DUF4349 domain-containing protein [Hyphomonadaceae bacterium]|nr:DUF4349 domain-containing protein [Hyphomonadaceae bacterium]
MFRVAIAAGLALLAAACGGSDGDNRYTASKEVAMDAVAGMPAPMSPPPPPPPPAPAMEMARSADGAVGGSVNFNAPVEQQIILPDQQGGGGGGQPAQLIAYTYNYGFKVPPAKMEGLLNAHKKACEDAGPAKCYVVNSSLSGIGEEQSSGYLQVRGSADWVKTFQTGMENTLKPFDANLDSNNDTAEDLTVQIVDSEARLKSMKTMRDRLQDLLRDRPGRLSDLLEIEREFARVQADIDSHESVLAALKLRVAMSIMTLNYQPKYEAASESIWRPLGDAFGSFVPNMAKTLAGIVEFIGEILPVALILGLVVWFVLWLFRRRGKSKKAKPNPLAPKPPAEGAVGS